MKIKALLFAATILLLIASEVAIGQANTSLSNLTTTSINQNLVPSSNNSKTLGTASKGWKNIYATNAVYLAGSRFLFNGSSTAKNTFVGGSAGISNTGSYNTALGNTALFTNSAGSFNTALGTEALYFNTGSYNTATGLDALYTNTSGNSNTANGVSALYSNTSGSYNIAVGERTLADNQTGYFNTAIGFVTMNRNNSGSDNTAVGTAALYFNFDGRSNVAVGRNAMYSMRHSSYNVAVGDSALFTYDGVPNDYMVAVGSRALSANTNGFYNTAVGGRSLINNTTGFDNTVLGTLALNTVTTGNYNTALGKSADVNATNRTNATAIGAFAIATADNQVMLGSTSVTAVWAAGPHVIYSDGRAKKNIKADVPGLAFINLLKPVTYNYDIHHLNEMIGAKQQSVSDQREKAAIEKSIASKEKTLYTGFVAQEVDAAAKKLNYDFSGVYKPQNDKDVYGLSYSDFVVPLVKAVQELSKTNEDKDAKIDAQQKQIDELKAGLQQLQQIVQNAGLNNTISANKQQNVATGSASLLQNVPNPAVGTTTIYYTLPQNYVSAKIVITDKLGKTIKEIAVTGNGKGSVHVNTAALAAGAYNYSLYVNAALIHTKEMVVSK